MNTQENSAHSSQSKEELRKEFDNWLNQFEKPNEYNRMYGHHFTSFKAGYDLSVSKLSQKEQEIDRLKKELDELKNNLQNQ